MKSIEGPETSGRLRQLRVILCAATALAAAGCVNPAFRESVGQFGTLTKATVATQNQRLAAVTASEQERIRADLARRRVQFALSRDCPYLMATAETEPPTDANVPVASESNAPATPDSDTTTEARQRAEVPRCRLVMIQTPGEAVAEAARYENIMSLTTALSNYSDSLVALAADSSADQKAFATSLSGLASSLGGLNGAIREAAGAPEQDLNAKLGAVATFVAEVGNLYFAHQRDRALREIIIKAGPFLERAVALLIEADQNLDLFERNKLLQTLTAAQRHEAQVAADHASSVAAIRAAQNEVYVALEAFNRANATVEPFRAIGVAHIRLVRAAQAGASAAELRAAIDAIIHLASTAHTTITTLQPSNGSSNNGN